MAAVPLSVLAVLLLTISPVSASPKSTPTPEITSWRGSPTSLSTAGGTVTFTGRFKYAQTCVLSVSPHITGAPWTSTCTSNSYSRKVSIGRNTTGSPKDYTFSFYVKNGTGRTSAANVVVAVGAAPPPISFTPTSLKFATQGVGIETTPVTVLVTNNSSSQSQDLTGFGMTGPDGGDFVINEGNCGVELSPRQSCDINITFKPQSNGTRIATAQIFDLSWGPNGTYALLSIHGAGEFAKTSVSTTDLVFGNEGVSVPTTYKAITITNSGSVPLSISGVSAVGGNSSDFSVIGNTCQNVVNGPTIISVGDNCAILVQFDPSASGARSSSVVLDDNTASAVTEIKLTGTGVWATSSLSVTNISFASTTVGDGTPVTVTITNTSPSVGLRFSYSPWYNFTGLDPGDFSFTPYTVINGSTAVQCAESGLVVAPGQSCEFVLSFTPISGGPRSATFDLFDNSLNSASTPGYEQITLSGTAET